MSPISPTFAVRSQRVVLPTGVVPATIVVQDGKVAEVLSADQERDVPGANVQDFGNLVISPGVIDAHVHVNDPRRTEWEGFETATKAAAAGGITTIVDMPLNSSPVTTTPAALAAKRQAATGKCWVDVGFYGGLVPGNAEQMQPLAEDGVLGVKAFLCHSGLDEFPNATETDLHAAMPALAHAGLPLLVHAELLTAAAPPVTDPRSFAQFVASRPEQWELAAIELIIRLCREYRCRAHIVHLATSAALPILAAAKREGLPITVETCPHYLFFDQVQIADGDTRFKCAPPIRAGEAKKLWQGLLAGTIDSIGSDHSPCPPQMKCLEAGDFSRAWGGIASLQLTLSTTWTFMRSQGCDDFTRLNNWLSFAPAKLVGIEQRKGKIAEGYDADVVVWDPDAQWTIRAAGLLHRHAITPYDGFEVQGQVKKTYVRGQLAYADGVISTDPLGELVSSSSTRASS